jgi:membrane protease YdiL (CAAX protease family)
VAIWFVRSGGYAIFLFPRNSGRIPWLDGRILFGAIVPVVSGVALTERAHSLGLGAGSARRGVVALALGAPVTIGAVAILASGEQVRGFYAGDQGTLTTVLASYAPRIAQVEVCFRGVLLFGLLPRVGRPVAIGLSVLPYGLVHLEKPLLEALGSVPVGLSLGAVALWTRSIWYGVLLHLTGSVVLSALARP